MSSVGSFFPYVNDARSHEPEVYKVDNFISARSHSTYPSIEMEAMDDDAALNDDH